MNKNNIAMLEEFKINLGFKVKRRNVRKNTSVSYITAAKQFVEYLGDIPLEQVIENDAMKWLDSCKNKMGGEAKASTRNTKLVGCNTFYNYLIDRKRVEINPFSKIKSEEIEIKGEYKNQDTKEPLEREELDRLKKVLDYNITHAKSSRGVTQQRAEILAYRNKAFTLFMLATGMRVQEVCQLKMNRITESSDHNTMVVTAIKQEAKGKKERKIDISKELYQCILDYREKSEIGDMEYVFTSKSGKLISTSDVNDMLAKICKQANIEKHISSHCLRHTFGTIMANETGNSQLVKDMMGHKTTKLIDERYWHRTKETSGVVCNI